MSQKQSLARVLLAVASFLVLSALPGRVFAGELLFSQTNDGQSTDAAYGSGAAGIVFHSGGGATPIHTADNFRAVMQ